MAADKALAYHERTKHHPHRFAASLGYMDWATQPNPFRRFSGAPSFPLDIVPPTDGPRYESAFVHGRVPAAAVDRRSISQLLQDSLALSAWKQFRESRWALRVNPSSGNLHPTEGYVIVNAVAGLHQRPAVYHYAPFDHALELRIELPDEAWEPIARWLPGDAFLIGLTSIFWRESWKYGERAFRYCQHDVGHAIAAIAIAAAGLGWRAQLLESVDDAGAARLLGVDAQSGPEAEHPECVIAICPSSALSRELWPRVSIATAIDRLRDTTWRGEPNRLSAEHHSWPVIDEVAAATEKRGSPGEDFWDPTTFDNRSLEIGDAPIALRRIVQQRRSAVAFDGRTGIEREAFYQVLLKVMPGANQIPFTTLPWHPAIDLLLFVHRVGDLAPGLYALARDPARRGALERAMQSGEFAWTAPPDCPASLPLFFLRETDARAAARQSSCGQEIASDGVFAVAMIADLPGSLDRFGAWFYRRLHWETGVIGQMLYLEAEATGVRGTGIGCFFDDLTRRTFALADPFQVLYHFTVGGAVEDRRLQTHPPYAHLRQSR